MFAFQIHVDGVHAPLEDMELLQPKYKEKKREKGAVSSKSTQQRQKLKAFTAHAHSESAAHLHQCSYYHKVFKNW